MGVGGGVLVVAQISGRNPKGRCGFGPKNQNRTTVSWFRGCCVKWGGKGWWRPTATVIQRVGVGSEMVW
jgi:hypothetical protein